MALALVDDLDELAGGDYAPFHTTRADLLRRLGRHDEAGHAYDQALASTANDAERRFLSGRRSALNSR